MATGTNYPDALAGGAAAARDGGPVLLTQPTVLPGATATELTRLAPRRIVVLGGPSVISDAVKTRLEGYTSGSVVRVAGADRYATASAISAAGTPRGISVAYVATGTNYPDALAAIPLAARTASPLLLTSPNSLPYATARELDRIRPGRIVVLGGPSVVSDGVMARLETYTSGTVTRIAGADRFATAAAIAGPFPAGLASVYLATGTSFADALAGGPAAATHNVPMLLATPTSLPAPTRGQLGRIMPRTLTILGGLGVLSDEVAASAAKAAR